MLECVSSAQCVCILYVCVLRCALGTVFECKECEGQTKSPATAKEKLD